MENVLNNIQSKPGTDAWEQKLKYQPYEKFCERFYSTLLNFSTKINVRTTNSMPNRMNLALAGKGHRTKY